jgi:hypothetical protein
MFKLPSAAWRRVLHTVIDTAVDIYEAASGLENSRDLIDGTPPTPLTPHAPSKPVDVRSDTANEVSVLEQIASARDADELDARSMGN